jgi:2-polyprenyl-3-methyl-5-hydroxy-6-metoxy-1,4-benzoquinol methylase
MSRISFQNYGRKAHQGLSHAEIAGRYTFQAGAERFILRDVLVKLELSRHDDLIEIGCGTGNLLLPMASRVRSVSGVDHPDLLVRLKARAPLSGVRLIPGNFLDVKIPGSYSKVLIYSVIHYLSSKAELLRFLDKAAALLKPGGTMLVGDVPNADRKVRFLASAFGKKVQRDWSRRVRRAGEATHSPEAPDRRLVKLDDAVLLEVLRHFRRKGLEAYALPEPADLPFSFTREDLLIRRPAA